MCPLNRESLFPNKEVRVIESWFMNVIWTDANKKANWFAKKATHPDRHGTVYFQQGFEINGFTQIVDGGPFT